MSTSSASSEHAPAGCNVDDEPNTKSIKDSALYAQQHISGDLHPAFVESGLSYEASSVSFIAEVDDVHDEAALFNSQRAFADALEKYQQGVKTKYKSEIDLGATHDRNEVMKYANEARDRYTGAGKEGIMKKIDHRLKTFQTAAPAVQAWLKLLPSTSTQLRKETLDALDQMPLCIEKAQSLVRTCGYAHVDQQTVSLYLSIIDALHHILEYYKRAAGSNSGSAFSKGPAFAELLKTKMKNMAKASQAMDERAKQWEHIRLNQSWTLAKHSTADWQKAVDRKLTVFVANEQVGDLKILAVEARNHLYAILKDTEVWQEALQAWKQSNLAKESKQSRKDRATMEQEGNPSGCLKSLHVTNCAR
ncbi:MAG: hypothetical protein Q9226_001165 [Calogaya cf. arnoldii]